jgi:hypothetical protein
MAWWYEPGLLLALLPCEEIKLKAILFVNTKE